MDHLPERGPNEIYPREEAIRRLQRILAKLSGHEVRLVVRYADEILNGDSSVVSQENTDGSQRQLKSRIRSVKNTKQITYAFIDSQNLNLSVRDLGWRLDYTRFRKYLLDKYGVQKAYMFVGYVPENAQLYNALQTAGFVCIFRPTLKYANGTVKGNCDAELVLQAMIDIDEYDAAIIVSGDGDFQCLAKHLHEVGKLSALLIPNRDKFSALLKFDFLKPYHRFVNDLRAKVEYKKKNPREDKHSKGKTSIGDSSSVAHQTAKSKKGGH